MVGFLGRNGAGKSTLLKLLSRIADPTEGRCAIKGRVSSLLEVGTGFHTELTGRDNVYMNGTFLGMSRREVVAKFDEMVASSGVARFLDTPIKRYSSRMKARLAFSGAAHLEPEILVIDEVLATGDAAFQRKCLGKMRDVAGSGRTVLFVSHNIAAVRNLCTRAITLREGRLVDDGPVDEVVRRYLAGLRGEGDVETAETVMDPNRAVRGTARVAGLRILDDEGVETREPVAGEPATVELDLFNTDPGVRHNVKLTVRNEDDAPILFLTPKSGGATLAPAARSRLRCTLPFMPLALGNYRIEAVVFDARGVSDRMANALAFTVETAEVPFGATAPSAKQAAVLTPQDRPLSGSRRRDGAGRSDRPGGRGRRLFEGAAAAPGLGAERTRGGHARRPRAPAATAILPSASSCRCATTSRIFPGFQQSFSSIRARNAAITSTRVVRDEGARRCATTPAPCAGGAAARRSPASARASQPRFPPASPGGAHERIVRNHRRASAFGSCVRRARVPEPQ